MASLCALIVLRGALIWTTDNTILCAVFGSIIFGAAGTEGVTQKALGWRPLVILGEASYAIYILHFPIWLW
jgi:peptidoglycan/LPS O-acetylase OafA/YrhL